MSEPLGIDRMTCDGQRHLHRRLGQKIAPKTYSTGDSLVVTEPTTSAALKTLSIEVGGVKKQGVSGSKNGYLFASVSAVRFKENDKAGCATEIVQAY